MSLTFLLHARFEVRAMYDLAQSSEVQRLALVQVVAHLCRRQTREAAAVAHGEGQLQYRSQLLKPVVLLCFSSMLSATYSAPYLQANACTWCPCCSAKQGRERCCLICCTRSYSGSIAIRFV